MTGLVVHVLRVLVVAPRDWLQSHPIFFKEKENKKMKKMQFKRHYIREKISIWHGRVEQYLVAKALFTHVCGQRS